MANSSEQLRRRLKRLGLSDGAISAAWPRWWSDDAEDSTSARAELHFSVARRLGLDPRSLVTEAGEPQFIWTEEARFKHLSGEDDLEQAGITSFGRAVSSILLSGTPGDGIGLTGQSPRALRESILGADQPYVGLIELLSLSWGVGVPVVHLRIFPWPQKRMAAMTVRLGDRWAVLLGKDSDYPAPVAFYLAHELGHIALEHVPAGGQIVDLEEEGQTSSEPDDEEATADAFALELLTGMTQPTVLPAWEGMATAAELARTAEAAGAQLRIEPGAIAQSYGHSTKDWELATAALKLIYPEPTPVWTVVNGIARTLIDWDELSGDGRDFLGTVLGEDPPG
jgi:hypothetical protein